jgi:hypothetical protein
MLVNITKPEKTIVDERDVVINDTYTEFRVSVVESDLLYAALGCEVFDVPCAEVISELDDDLSVSEMEALINDISDKLNLNPESLVMQVPHSAWIVDELVCHVERFADVCFNSPELFTKTGRTSKVQKDILAASRSLCTTLASFYCRCNDITGE